jgi:hypothetical protein
MSGGECQTKNVKDYEGEEEEAPAAVLDEGIYMLKSYSPVLHRLFSFFFC